jgi:HAD superfamily hydrolase (TIGR01450 family)
VVARWCYPSPVSATSSPPITAAELLERYDVFLLDGHGVLINSAGALPGAADFLRQLEERRKHYVLLSNDASRSPAAIVEKYRGVGLELEVDRVLSSGLLLREYFASEGLRGRSCIVLGTHDATEYVTSAGGIVVAPHDDKAEVIVVADQSGYPFLDTVNDVVSVLLRRIDCGAKTTLILANPDVIYPRGAGAFGVAAGSVAALLEATLLLRDPSGAQRFVRLGKPHPAMFAAAISRLAEPDPRRIVMLGDQLATDILGAHNVGIDSVLVLSGISRLSDLATSAIRPTYTLDRL